MTDSSSRPHTATAADTSTPPGMPRWVKLFGIVAIALVLILVGVMAVSGSEHGPGRHMPSGSPVDAGIIAAGPPPVAAWA